MSHENEPVFFLGLVYAMFSLNIIIGAEINSSHLPILFFDKLQASHRDMISSILFKCMLLFHHHNWGFSNFATAPTEIVHT
jgi:hypothetical protein